jgi:hypothetical protein
MLWILLVVLLVLALVGLPPLGVYPHAYGYYPSGLLGVILIVVLILLLVGRV